jgi:hypothetical protein|uniref:Uncharacterized protein n=1 Tax=Siphoviridae sp. ctHip2 TaxID=2827830 RepID=A0A8S5RWP0_9CAUD|nr:MAG TPA: hypothetical protein [Siphoviridae sp. ctHip2]
MKKYLGNKLTKEEIINNLESYKMIFVEFNNYEKFIELFKAIEQLGYNSEWTEEEDMTSIMNLKVVEEDLKKRYESLWLNICTERKTIDLSTFYHVQKGVFNNQKVAYGTMLEKSEYIHNGHLYI